MDTEKEIKKIEAEINILKSDYKKFRCSEIIFVAIVIIVTGCLYGHIFSRISEKIDTSSWLYAVIPIVILVAWCVLILGLMHILTRRKSEFE